VKTDSIFYRIFQEFPSIFFELLGNSIETAETYQFTSQEVKQLAFRIDGLFIPKNDKTYQPFYLVEVQFQPDKNLYYRLFSELFLYLKQYQPNQPWRIVIIYPTRSIEREETLQFGDILALERVTRIYLDELEEERNNSLGIKIVKLIIESNQTIEKKVRILVDQARQQLTDETVRLNLINLLEVIMVYKLPNKSREEIAAMFGLSDLQKTRFYQEVKLEVQLETKLETIPKLIQEGLTVEQIARILELSLEVVEQEVEKFQQELQ
jgi:predicted transposase/invertase (TIGR01784 family)